MNLTATSTIRVFVYAIVLGSSLGRFSLYAQCPVNLNVSVAQNATGQYVATIDTNGTWLDYSYRNTGSSIPGPDSHMEVVLDTTCQAAAELLTVRVGKAGCEQVAESTQSVGPPDTTPQLKLTAEGNSVNAYVTVPNATAPSIQAVEFKYGQIPRVSFSGAMLTGPGATVGQGPGAVLAEARSCTGRISVDTASVGTTCDEETSQKCDICSECVGTPVHTLSGSMTYDETQPIAGLDWLPFRLTYNSVQTQVGPFGAGWHSLFSSSSPSTPASVERTMSRSIPSAAPSICSRATGLPIPRSIPRPGRARH